MLKSIHIENFKSYRSATLHLAPLTVLIGANASGKSNALEAIRLLSWLAQGQKLSSLQYQVNQNDRVVRGHVQDLARKEAANFLIGCSTKETQVPATLKIKVVFREGEGLHIESEECIKADDNFLYRTVRPSQGAGTDILVEYNNFAPGRMPRITCHDQQGIFTQLGNAARFSEGHSKSKKVIPNCVRELEHELAEILFLDPVPHRMREYSFPSESHLNGDGSNLSSVLWHLCRVPEFEGLLLNFIQSLPEQEISSINFIRTPRGEVMLRLEETFGGSNRYVDADLLSDGTLRVLAIAAALLSAPVGSMVIIEEIDNGVHPSRARRLLDSISAVAESRGLSILISSHNPALLDALPDSAIPNVVFCYRDRTDGYSKLVRLQDVPDYPELIGQGSLGELVTHGVLERFVKDYQGAEKKKEQALSWLESIAHIGEDAQ
jgi:predicted ATPase